MLIVAMPKTASTSVMVTLGRLAGLPSTQLMFPAEPWPRGWFVVPRFHRDMRELNAERASAFRSSDHIYKQHVIPTSNNLEHLAGIPVVLLTRDPRDIVGAYRRVVELKGGGEGAGRVMRHEFDGLETADEWERRADEMGLLDELNRFRDIWLEQPGTLAVSFEELTGDPTNAVRKMQAHLGLDVTRDSIELEKMRWSRGSADDYRSPGSGASSGHVGLRVARRIKKAFR